MVLLTTLVALAAPFDLTHSGRLIDSAGEPYNGSATLTITAYYGSETHAWSLPNTPIDNGFYSVVLTDVDTEWFSSDVELGISVDGAPELLPRSPVASVPRAHVARGLIVDTTGDAVACEAEGQMVWDRAQQSVKVCNGTTWVAVGGTRTVVQAIGGRQWSDGRAGQSCEDYIRPSDPARLYTGATGDGVYQIDPDGTGPIAPVALWCDMTTDGGGWTVIGRTHSGAYPVTDAAYIDLVANPSSHVSPAALQSAALPSSGTIAWLDRPFTNALHLGSDIRVVRVDFDGPSAQDGRYYQRRVNASDSFDLWHAIRDSRVWGDGNDTSNMVGGFGSSFILNAGSVWNESTQSFPHAGDGSFGFWDDASLTLNTGETLSVGRHAGLLCDGYNSQGDLWLYTLTTTDSRWKSDTADRRAVVWFR